MKKGSVKISGLLTTIFSFLLFLLMAFLLLYMFELLSAIPQLEQIAEVSHLLFVYPIEYIFEEYLSLSFEMLPKVIIGVFTIFTFVMAIWGIKEMTLVKKDDESFARCKKSCALMMTLKFLFFLYNVFILVFSFVEQEVTLLFYYLNLFIGVPYFSQIVYAVLSIVTLINFLLPVLAFSKAAKLLKDGGQGFTQNNVKHNKKENYYQDGNAEGYYDGNVYQAPYYDTPQGEPIKSIDIIQPDRPIDENAILIVPGQNGVPKNITQKGINDLIRLERLRASGALDEQNYAVMKKKICSTNIS